MDLWGKRILVMLLAVYFACTALDRWVSNERIEALTEQVSLHKQIEHWQADDLETKRALIKEHRAITSQLVTHLSLMRSEFVALGTVGVGGGDATDD
jgi:hypothetical protein